MPSAQFTFEGKGSHTVRIEGDWIGRERYFVDGKLALSKWSLLGGSSRFTAHGAEIEVVIKFAPRFRGVQSSALVNGQVVAEDLFADYNKQIEDFGRRLGGTPGDRSLGAWLSKMAVWTVLAFFFFLSIGWLRGGAA
jgi:hypothetical protein